MNVFLVLIIILLVSNLLVFLAKRIKISSEVALIITGLILGLPFIKERIVAQNEEIILILGDVGLICLMFIAGLETSWKKLFSEKKDSILIASFSFAIPFLFGLVTFLVLGFPILISVVIGIGLALTAEATKTRVLIELDILKTRLGAAVMGAGIIDDIFGLLSFSIIIFLLRIFYLKESLLLVGAIISFLAGILIQRIVGRWHSKVLIFERILLLVLIPFFFVSLGINFNHHSLIINPMLMLTILIIAVLSKFIGVVLVKPFTDLKWKQLYIIGWAMNSRGALEIAFALIALRVGLLNDELYSSLIVMTLITTMIFPFIAIRMIKKDPEMVK
jgi:Kef-type K+ transport system membrane component KefB